MIRSFADRDTTRLFQREPVRRFPIALQHLMLRTLGPVDAAEQSEDLRVPPGNRLEKLKGNRAGQHGVRIDDQWRICFRWKNGNACDVVVVEDHERTVSVAYRELAPIHPGEALTLDFLEPLGLAQHRLAKDVSVPARRINEIVHGTRAMSADTALRPARYFGTSDRFWLNLQARYDLEIERDHLGARLEKEVRVLERAK